MHACMHTYIHEILGKWFFFLLNFSFLKRVFLQKEIPLFANPSVLHLKTLGYHISVLLKMHPLTFVIHT